MAGVPLPPPFAARHALSFRLTSAVTELDACNRCSDFGGLRPVKIWLHEMFDHTLLVAADDPGLADFRRVAGLGFAEPRVPSAVGCEAVARHVFEHASLFADEEMGGRVWLEEVEMREHAGDSAA